MANELQILNSKDDFKYIKKVSSDQNYQQVNGLERNKRSCSNITFMLYLKQYSI